MLRANGLNYPTVWLELASPLPATRGKSRQHDGICVYLMRRSLVEELSTSTPDDCKQYSEDSGPEAPAEKQPAWFPRAKRGSRNRLLRNQNRLNQEQNPEESHRTGTLNSVTGRRRPDWSVITTMSWMADCKASKHRTMEGPSGTEKGFSERCLRRTILVPQRTFQSRVL